MANLRCDVCAIEGHPVMNAGWRKLWLDHFDNLHVSADLERGVSMPQIIAIDEATACGQTHALILTERYLERGTFAPADFAPPAPASIGDGLEGLT